jgi:hypothetical protein
VGNIVDPGRIRCEGRVIGGETAVNKRERGVGEWGRRSGWIVIGIDGTDRGMKRNSRSCSVVFKPGLADWASGEHSLTLGNGSKSFYFTFVYVS